MAEPQPSTSGFVSKKRKRILTSEEIDRILFANSDSEIEFVISDSDFDFSDTSVSSESPPSSPEPSEDVSSPHFQWSDSTGFSPIIHQFNVANSGLTDIFTPKEDDEEVDLFLAFFDKEVINLLVTETNNYYRFAMSDEHSKTPKVRKWNDTTEQEMYVFLSLLMLMSHVRKHVIREYWKEESAAVTPTFCKYMSRDRFELIMRFLHFSDNFNPSADDRLWKIRSFFELVKGKFSGFFYPFKKLVIDESLVLFRGCVAFRQYIPSKRHRFGIKFFVLCDCETGIVLDMLICTKTDVDIPKDAITGFSGSVVKTLLAKYLGKGHVLYTDNWYTSPVLCEYLHNNATGSCGTVKKNRKRMPSFPEKLKAGDVSLRKTNKLLAIKWHDKRDVLMLTTVHEGELVQSGKRNRKTKKAVLKPDAVLDYNINMRLVDKSDSQISSLECLHKSVKWYKKVFFHLLDISRLNAYNMYLVRTGHKTSLRKFSMSVVEQLLRRYGKVTQTRPGRLSTEGSLDRLVAPAAIGRHYLAPIPGTGKRQKGQRQCQVCNKTKQRPQVVKKVSTYCPGRNVGLCVGDCFRDYHTLKEY